MKRKTAITLLQLILFTALGGGIVWYMLVNMEAKDRSTMLNAVAHTNLLWLLPFFFFYLLSQWARAKRWMLMLDPIAIHPTAANTLAAVLIGYLVNLIPPRAGEVAKCTILARYEKMPADKMIGTIVAERSFDVICLLLIVGAGIFWQDEALHSALRGLRNAKGAQAEKLKEHALSAGQISVWLGVVCLIVCILIVVYKRNKNSRAGRFIGGLGSGFSSIFHLRQKGLFLLYTGLIWGGYIAQLLFGFQAMPATQHLGTGVAVMTLIFGSVAIIAAPGGIGLYPFLVGKLLRFGYGLSLPDANAFGWVSWVALTAATLVAGVASLLLLPLYNRQPHDSQAPVDTEQDP